VARRRARTKQTAPPRRSRMSEKALRARLRGSFALEYWTQPSPTEELGLWIVFGTVFPGLFFRHARGLW
jgi:hypothetical protein